MQIYLVGGAVRDQLLGVPVHEHDWVVTGATPEQMIKLGYQQVGSDFPVFLHPKTRDEYALARTERKQGSGYTGFICNSDSSISLQQDLIRRDLTINAIAQDKQGKLIDPYGGQKDLVNKVLRHVSDAFIEDPLRVLRVARFAARYHHLGFTVAPETMTLMTDMATSGELNHLKPERVWKELSRSLLDPQPGVFIEVLRECGALAHIMPELDVLWGIPNPVKWHPEIDTGIHTLMVLAAACQRSPELSIRFGALVHDLGKAATPPQCWPSHKGHETLGVAIIEKLCARLRIPNDCRDLAVLMSQHHSLVHRLFENSAEKVLQMFDQCDLWRKPERFNQLLICCESDFAGRKGFENRPYPQRKALEDCALKAQSVNIQAIIADGHKGAEIKTELSRQRTIIIQNVLAQHQAAM